MKDYKIIPVNYNPVSDTGTVITISKDDWIMEYLINYGEDSKLNIIINSEGHIAAVSFKREESSYKEDGLCIIKENK